MVKVFRFDVLFRIMVGEGPIVLSMSLKLSHKQHFLNFILYMKHDNVTMYDAFMWDWSKFALCDDAIFMHLKMR